jgi:hypothetical protein
MGQSKMDNPEALATLSTRHRRKRKTKHNIENKKISNKDPTKKTSAYEWQTVLSSYTLIVKSC